jgi:hypothetical protein
MTLNNYKIPVIVGRNDTPTTNVNQSNHPNGAFFVNKYNGLIDDLITNGVSGGSINLEDVRNAISVTGNGSYNPANGIINISNASMSVDHIEKSSTVGLIDIYTIWGDVSETINLGTFSVSNGTNGTNGTNGASVDHISLTNTTGLVKTYTAWGNVAETINLGTFSVTNGVVGTNGASVDHISLTNTTGLVKTYTAWGNVAETIN